MKLDQCGMCFAVNVHREYCASDKCKYTHGSGRHEHIHVTCSQCGYEDIIYLIEDEAKSIGLFRNVREGTYD